MQKADVWAAGVTLYMFLYGRLPFMDKMLPRLYDAISVRGLHAAAHRQRARSIHAPGCAQTLVPEFPPGPSPEAISLLQGLLEKDPERRVSIEQVKVRPPACHRTAACLPPPAA